ncbi:MAG TPA: tRNA (adenosine(37)-N6)-threonylcarbamoyltransferase complex dimerization subunit type 1 TsaB [Gammaproteobacteria bacterium]|nr:tRNA (adenosine(37)-N6)-threonylcarbamoyltransferase complex dimerization subunit type 1 TsaB [Gammaproteobacteria bacterium]
MNILALETSTQQCTVALLTNSGILERSQMAERAHAEMILPMVEILLTEAGLSLNQLDALAFGRGPGGFTGVRVATAVVQGLAFGAQLPVVPVSDLMALAAGAYRVYGAKKILACMDARMGQVYWCVYTVEAADDLTACLSETLSAPHSVQLPDTEEWFRAGSGFNAYKDVLEAHLGSALHGQDAALLPVAQDIAVLARLFLTRGQAVSAEAALPVYLRDQVAWPKSGL